MADVAMPCLERAEVRQRVSGAKAGSCMKDNRPKTFGMTAEDKTTISFNLVKVDTYSYVDGEQEWYKDDIVHERRVPGLKVNMNRPGNKLGLQAPLDNPRPKQRTSGRT